jgi:hypothetical protein
MIRNDKIARLREYCRDFECTDCTIGGFGECKEFSRMTDEELDAALNFAYPYEFDAVKPPIDKPTIKDSGNRREFGTGAVRDMAEGKGRMDLLPWAAIMEISKHCENGAKKYGEHNVDKGIPTHSLCDSAARHLAKYLDGWTDEPHLLAAAWNLLWAIQMELKHPEVVDTPWKGGDE